MIPTELANGLFRLQINTKGIAKISWYSISKFMNMYGEVVDRGDLCTESLITDLTGRYGMINQSNRAE